MPPPAVQYRKSFSTISSKRMLKKLAVVTIRAECTNVDVSSFFPLEDFLNLKGDFVKLKMVNLNKDLIFLLESNCFY